MKVKHIAWLATAISMGSVLAVHADEAAIKRAEKNLKYFETKYGEKHNGYSYTLLNTAQVYYQNGKRLEAKKLSDKLLKLEKERGLSKYVGMMAVWGAYLINTRPTFKVSKSWTSQKQNQYKSNFNKSRAADMSEGKRLLLEAKNYRLNCLSVTPTSLFAQTSILSCKDKELAASELSSFQAELEKEAKAVKSADEIIRLAYSYDRLAQVYRGKGKASNEKACKIKKDAISVWNKLPKTHRGRLMANRRAVAWFRSMGKEDYAKEQTSILAKQLGTNDPAKLFPPRPPCPACGMG